MLSSRKFVLLRAAGITFLAALVIYSGLSAIGARIAMEIPRLPLIAQSPASIGMVYQDVTIPSQGDGLHLRGWFFSSKGDSVIIVINGGFQNRVDANSNTLGLASDLVQEGYSVLLFDLRGRGESEGEGKALSNIEQDIGGAIDYLKQTGYTEKQIYIIGFSSGAASTCIYASRHTLGGVVLDGCFADAEDVVAKKARQKGVPEFVTESLLPGILFYSRISYGYQPVNPIDVVDKIISPTFFIHEEKDDLISWEETQKLFNLSTASVKEKWEVGSAEHSLAYKSQPDEYIARITGFLGKARSNGK